MLLASDFDQSRFLRAEGFERDKKFRVKAVTPEMFERGGKTEKKLVVSFTNSEQALILNKTNLRTIQGAFGNPLAGWIGKIIVVFPTTTDVGGKVTPCLRVRIPPPTQAAAAPQQPVTPGNGVNVPAPAGNGAAAAAAVAAAVPPVTAVPAAVADPELNPDPVKLIGEEMDDEIPY